MHTPSAARTARRQHLEAMAAEVERRIESDQGGGGAERRGAHAGDGVAADGGRPVRDGQSLRAAQSGRPGQAPIADPKLGRRLGKLAKRAEEIALDLEHP